mgnify:CR=1 FL=1
MTPFSLIDGELHAEGVALSGIARQFGTPCYVYSRAALEGAYRAFDAALAGRPHLVCYAMKANSNIAILDLFARLGSGFDIVSAGELQRVLAAGGDPAKIVFSGVGKSEADIRAGLEAGIRCFNVESRSELHRLSALASALGKRAAVSLRVNPDVDAGTHPYISTGLKENKFGVAFEDAIALYADGGLGIRYADETPPLVSEYVSALVQRLEGRDLELLFEPGRALVGNAGLLLTRVEYLKPGPARSFCIVDAAMNDLMRPSLYDAYHGIVPVRPRDEQVSRYEVVGPVCESGDFLGHDRDLALAEGDLLAVMSAGAYGMSMASNYNTRPRAAEVLVDGREVHLIRARETAESLFALERRLP